MTVAWCCAKSAGIVQYVVGGGASVCVAGGARFYVRKSVNGAAACCACWALLPRSKCGGRCVPPWYRGGPWGSRAAPPPIVARPPGGAGAPAR